jgi:hypothetical protein
MNIMKTIKAIKAIAVSVFLLTTAGFLQAQTVTGKIYYAGNRITDEIKSASFSAWMRNEGTGKEYSTNIIYDPI